MLKESIQQYRDYFEDDPEEQKFFEYMDNLSNRDQIRFMEVFEDFTISKFEQTAYVMIPKREFNPELSTFSNFMLDMVDFKDRVRPQALDIARLDVSRNFQPRTVKELEDESHDMIEELEEFGIQNSFLTGDRKEDEGQRSLDDRGYSSLEIADKSEGDTDAAKPDLSETARQAIDAETDPDADKTEDGEEDKKE